MEFVGSLRRWTLLQTEPLGTIKITDAVPRGPAESNEPSLGRLLSLFPKAKPAQIPIQVGLVGRTYGSSERSTIMFRGGDVAIFPLTFPLYEIETVRLRPNGTQCDTSAKVVAIMPIGVCFAVAVRFIEGVPKWLLKA